MNIAVLSIKDVFKYILKFFIMIILIVLLANIIKGISSAKKNVNIKETIDINTSKINNSSFLECIDLSLSLISYNKNKKERKILTNNKIISMGAGVLDEKILKSTDLLINKEELTQDDVEELQNSIADIPKNAVTESIEENNISPRITDSYEDVKINNQSDYDITEEMLIPDVEITNKKDILIYHTHTCESYTASPGYEYEMTGNYRTTDLNYSVARVGEELTNYLKNKGFNVEHNTTYHDYPAYSGSYARSLRNSTGTASWKRY